MGGGRGRGHEHLCIGWLQVVKGERSNHRGMEEEGEKLKKIIGRASATGLVIWPKYINIKKGRMSAKCENYHIRFLLKN